MLSLEATVTWTSIGDGGMESPYSGIRPNFLIANDLITSVVRRLDGESLMSPEETYAVLIVLPYGEIYSEHMKPGLEFNLQSGARVLAHGVVTRVLPAS